MTTVFVTPDTKILEHSVRYLILTNQVVDILLYLKSNYNLILDDEDIKLLHSPYKLVKHGYILRISENGMKLRNTLIKFNKKRKQLINYLNYLENDECIDITSNEGDSDLYIEELRFGL